MPFQITRTGAVRPTGREVAALKAAFEAQHCVRLPGFLEPALLRRLQSRLAEKNAWKPHVHDLVNGLSTELVCSDETTVGLLTAMFHDAAVFESIRAITECDRIGSFHGRIYRMDANAHTDVWHTDANGKYLIALSLNLSPGPFAGGELHLRECDSKRMRAQVANTGQGDAIIFRIDGSLEHVVTPVTSEAPKIAWAGWFHLDELLPELSRLAGVSTAW